MERNCSICTNLYVSEKGSFSMCPRCQSEDVEAILARVNNKISILFKSRARLSEQAAEIKNRVLWRRGAGQK